MLVNPQLHFINLIRIIMSINNKEILVRNYVHIFHFIFHKYLLADRAGLAKDRNGPVLP